MSGHRRLARLRGSVGEAVARFGRVLARPGPPVAATVASQRQQPAATVTIAPYKDGPLLVRGDFVLQTSDGVPIDARRATIALCRCGKSATKPFCDGTHKAVGFRAASAPQQS